VPSRLGAQIAKSAIVEAPEHGRASADLVLVREFGKPTTNFRLE
jgi:hypothetical protein